MSTIDMLGVIEHFSLILNFIVKNEWERLIKRNFPYGEIMFCGKRNVRNLLGTCGKAQEK